MICAQILVFVWAWPEPKIGSSLTGWREKVSENIFKLLFVFEGCVLPEDTLVPFQTVHEYCDGNAKDTVDTAAGNVTAASL